MTPLTNRKLHALAGKINKADAHDILKEAAFQLFQKQSLGELTEKEAAEIVRYLNATINTTMKKALPEENGEPLITITQLRYARDLQTMLGWSSAYLETMIAQRYQEDSLESMPEWKAVRLIAEIQKRWHSKKKQAAVHKS